MIYEKYVDGRLVERVRPLPGKYDDTRLGVARLERQQAGERNGWYEAGEWPSAEAAREAESTTTAADEPAPEKTTRRGRTPTTEEG